MTFSLSSDPARRAGGYARLDTGGLAQEGAPVAIRRDSDGMWLSPTGWQPARVELDLRADAQGVYTLPPGVVDVVEPHTVLTFECGDVVDRLTWPSSVRKSRGRRSGAGLAVAASAPPKPQPAPPPRVEETPPSDEPIATMDDGSTVEEQPLEPDPVVEPDTQEPRKSRKWLWLILGIGLLLAAGAAYWWFFVRETIEDEPENVVTDVVTPTPVEPDPCASDIVEQSLELGYETAVVVLDECADALDPSLAIRIIEAGLATEHPDALLRMARLRDPAFESFMAPDASVSLGYYQRAVAAGSEQAVLPMSRLCAELADSDDILVVMAVQEICAE